MKIPALWTILTVAIVGLLSGLNILYFISQAASPIITSDAWYFLDEVVKKWAQFGFDWPDLFIKRGLTDHAQPLNKIILWINYTYLGLDFKYESLFGFTGLIFSLLVFAGIYVDKATIARGASWQSLVMFCSAVLILFSLNSTDLYTWPLVTFGFLVLFLAITVTVLTWKYLNNDAAIGILAICALLLLLIGDTGSIILCLSLFSTVTIFYIKNEHAFRRMAKKWMAVSALFMAIFFLLLNAKYFFNPISTDHAAQAPTNWLDPFLYLDALRIVFSASLVQGQHLTTLDPSISWVIFLIVFGFYIKHFLTLIFSTTSLTLEKFLTTSLLIYAAVSVVAIAYGRIPIFGVNYLNQPRYVLTYQLIPFSLLMDYAFTLRRETKQVGKGNSFAVLLTAVMVFILQFNFSMQAYSTVEWISRYQAAQATAIGHYLEIPTLPAGDCSAVTVPICNMPVYKRNELLSFLENKRLNILNFSFQWKYRLFPLSDNSVDLKDVKVLGWGPISINSKASTAEVWIKLSRGLVDARSRIIVKMGDYRIDPVVDGSVIAFTVPPEISRTSGQYSIQLIGPSAIPITVGILEVK